MFCHYCYIWIVNPITMKKSLLSILIFILSVFCVSAQTGPVATFDRTTVEIGQILRDTSVTKAVYKLTNTGDKPLIIYRATPGCKCMKVDFPTKPIEPGASASVVVSYSGKNQPGGPFKKDVCFATNSSNPYCRIFVKGEVVSEISVPAVSPNPAPVTAKPSDSTEGSSGFWQWLKSKF